jgi:tetratricopeptide (TPR) repeat protein
MFRLTPIALHGLFLALLLVPLTSFTETRSNTSAATDTSLLRFTDKFYAINLDASDNTTSPAVMRKAYPDLIVYQTHVNVAGSRLNYLRLGFFANKDEARATLATVRSWYPDAWVVQITPLEQVTALGVDLDALAQTAAHPAPASAPPSVPQPPTAAAAKPSAGYTLHLDVAANPQFTLPTLPPTLMGYRFYVQRLAGAQGAEFHLNLGVFADRKGAERARDELRARYPQAALHEITASEKAQVAALPMQPAPVVAAQPVAPGVAAKPAVHDVATKTATAVVAAIPALGAAAKPAAPDVTVKPAAPVVVMKPAVPEVVAKPGMPDVTVKPAAPVVTAKSAPSVVAKPAVPEIAVKPAASDVKARPAASGGDDTERQARTLLDLAQDQIIARQFDTAVKTLGEILTLPKNIHTADAMEFTGLAYDQAGKAKQAIQYYQKYLNMYPDSRSGYRIRQRLQTLQK